MKNLLLLFCLVVLAACKSKSSACANVSQTFDPIAKELDAIAKAADTAPAPSPADPSSCAQLADRLHRIESAEGKLAVIVTDDAPLAKHLDAYRRHVDAWAKSTKKAQAACLSRDGNAMTAGISESIQHRAQLAPAAADVTTYCKAP
jgi:hypothetical protein